MSIDAYEKINFDNQVAISSEHVNKNYKILLINQNSLDILLVNKLLKDLGNFKVYEAGNIKAALKIVSYMSLDLIIVDDKLPTVSGTEIITKLNRSQLLKDVPKVMLLTENYKENHYAYRHYENLDFIKKPIDSLIFKTRIHSILKSQQDNFMSGSLFENMIDRKIDEAKEFLKIYKSFLDIDQNLLFVYDKKGNQVVESNKNFIKFFGENRLFNRVVSNPRLLKRFVPSISDPNYLNSHHVATWLDLITSAQDFNFLITIKNRSKTFSFNVLVNKMKLFNKDMYIVKLSNHILDISSSKKIKFQNQKVNSYLSLLQGSLNALDEREKKVEIEHNIKVLLDELKISSSHFERHSKHRSDEINVHFVIASILKERSDEIDATLNLMPIDKEFKPDFDTLHAKISPDALRDAIRGILDSYHDTKDLKVDVKFYELNSNLKIEIITTSDNQKYSGNNLVNRFFKKDNEDDFGQEPSAQVAPKHVQNALIVMKADIKTYFNNGQNIFLLTIPLT
jgi:DNA-binding response OmpR family regulator